MKREIRILLFILMTPWFAINAQARHHQQDVDPSRIAAQKTALEKRDNTNETLSAVEPMASGAMGYLRRILDPVETGGLPRNEAKQSELNSGVFQSDFFVPAQVGHWMTAAILSHAWRMQDSSFTAGFSTEELLIHLNSTVSALETILDNHAFVDPQTGKKALYQVHKIVTGEAPRRSDFESIVSMLDNAFLIVGLQVTASYVRPIDGGLADRIDLLLDEFDFGMWVQNGQMFLGAPENPRSGSILNRIVTEGRIAVVAGRARGEISEADFEAILRAMHTNSVSRTTPGGVEIAQLPFFGTALEIWAVTPFLSNELETRFGSETLLPLAEAWEETRTHLALPAAGATGIADGFGGFKLFTLSPAEGTSSHLDQRVLVPPAAGILAGAVGTPGALQNLEQTFAALEAEGEFNAEFGVPNYLDFGTGLVNESDPVRGTLEIAQMAVALLNHLLGRRQLENLLREDQDWNTALDAYTDILNRNEDNPPDITKEAEDSPTGPGNRIPRSAASGTATWRVEEVGDEVSWIIPISIAQEYVFKVRYSNDDIGTGDDVTVLVNGAELGSFHSTDTGDNGLGWNVFVDSSPIMLGMLDVGEVTISLRLDTSDGFGIEYDRLTLKADTSSLLAPSLISPANGAAGVSRSPQLEWSPVAGIDSFHVQVATDAQFTSVVKNADPHQATTFEASDLDAGVRHYWRVRSRQGDTYSAWSVTWSFTTEGASSMNTIMREAEDNPSGPGHQVPRSAASGTATWRVEDVDDQVSWTIPIAVAGEYELTVRYGNDDTGVGDSVTVLINGIETDAFPSVDTKVSGDSPGEGWNRFTDTPPIMLGVLEAGEIMISLRLDATDGFGIEYDKLTLAADTSSLLLVPVLVSPANGATGVSTSPQLEWNPVAGIDSFHVQVATDAQFTSIVKNADPHQATTFEASDLDVEVRHYWRVRSRGADTYSAWSEVWSFTTAMDVAIEPIDSPLPADYHLAQNYPNPFNATTTIEFDLPQSSYVTLKVYDLRGREVATLASGSYPAGRYNINWNASKLASGVYVYRLQAGTYSEINRLVLLK